jgi:Glycosyltransferase family 87
LRKPLQPVVGLVLAAVAAASMWFYVIGILRARQVAEAEAKQIPRGNLSDLYPRWLGARELLLHHRNPYSREVTLEIQEGYYGRRLDPARPNDPKDQQGFAYPVYVVFLLAPLVGIPFPALLILFYWSLVLLTAASVWLWLRTLRWRLPPMAVASCMVLTLGSFPAVQGIKLQQLSLLVAALLAGSSACVASGFLFCGGAMLALATIKPQLAWPLVAWLLLWAIGDWRGRRRLVFGFGLSMVLLLGGAEIILPGWWRMFAEALGQYRHYTQSQSVLEVMLNEIFGSAASGVAGRLGGQILAATAVLACVPVLWKLRRQAADASRFSCATALVLALTVLVAPMYAPYNQVLLLPAILVLVRERALFLSRSRGRRLAYQAGALVVGWQWVASLGLMAVYWLVSRDLAFRGWEWPFFATFALPVWVFALIFLYVKDEPGRVQDLHS